MIAALVILYALIGAAVATESYLRMRDAWLKDHVSFEPDSEDLGVAALGGMFWPLTVTGLAWHRLYEWRKARRGEEEAA